jgi:hypothetical protein
MRKFSIYGFVLLWVVSFCFTAAYAQPASKATAQLGDLSVVPLSPKDNVTWYDIFDQKIKTPNGKDLFIHLSLESGLTTNTKAMSKQLQKSLVTAEACVMVRVLVDGVPVKVNNTAGNDEEAIIFARRQQTLAAEFAGYIAPECYVITEDDLGNHTVTIDPDCITPETLQFIFDTMSANSFGFCAYDVASGAHTVTVQAALVYDADYNYAQQPFPEDAAYSAATAILGNGCVTIETVRMIKEEDVIVDLE